MSVAERVSEWIPVLWFVVAVGILAILWLSGTLEKLLRRVTKFGGFGLSFEFTEASARQTRESVEDGLGVIRKAIQRKLAGDVRSAGLQEAFRTALESTDLNGKTGYRATIHIQDPLYANQLYQLLNYYPKGKGAGRTFSARAGIIGMAWRTLEPDSWNQASTVTWRDLMQKWGMTADEAQERQSADSKKLFLAVPLFDPMDAVPIGVFYFDADDREGLGLNALPPLDDLTEEQKKAADDEAEQVLNHIGAQFINEFKERKMADVLAKLVEAIKKESPLLNLEAQ